MIVSPKSIEVVYQYDAALLGVEILSDDEILNMWSLDYTSVRVVVDGTEAIVCEGNSDATGRECALSFISGMRHALRYYNTVLNFPPATERRVVVRATK